MKPVDYVKIEKLIPIYKNGEPALNIEVARIMDKENNSCEFNIIVGKRLYNIGDEVVYIMPDYCIPNSELFREYHEPDNNPSKSKLGKRGRIKSIKFNFQFAGESDPIYSNGILLPFDLVNEYLNKKYTFEEIQNGGYLKDLDELLGVFKYVAEDSAESTSNGLTKGELPVFLYATDEERIELKKAQVERCYEEKEIIAGSIKVDGSSTTLYYKLNLISNEYEKGICSRKQEKKLEQTFISGYKDDDGNVLHQYFNKDSNEKGWYNDSKQKFYTQKEVDELKLESITIEIRDSFVDTCKKYNYLDKLVTYCTTYNVQLALRGELIGSGNKGSGKKLNQDAKGESRVKFFGVDDLSNGFAKRINYSQEHNLKKVCEELELEYTISIFEGIFTYDELIKKSNEIFKDIKTRTGQIIEGIVFRTVNSNKLSCKYINPEYDSQS